MSLQLALILIGIVIIIVVAISAYDQGRLIRGLRRSPPPPPRTEPLLSEPEAATALDIDLAPPLEADARLLRSDAPHEPRTRSADEELRAEIEALEEVATMPLDLAAGRDGSHTQRPDERIDFVLHLPGGEPVARNSALGIFKQNEYRLEKRRALYGQRLGSQGWSELEHDREDQRYSDLALAIQLVDERGPIDESELNTFAQVGLKLADALHRPTRFSMAFEAALERAHGLAQFCETYDVIAAINVVARDEAGFTGAAIRTAAEALGMQFGAMNIFHMKNEASVGCRHLFSMANLRQPGEFKPGEWEGLRSPGLTLFMSVPCAHRPAVVFERMLETAHGLAERLDGHLLDQDLKPLSERGIAVIRGQIDEIEERMRAFGVAPGGESALRLFSFAKAADAPAATELNTADA